MSLHHVLQDLKISKCKWLGPECTDDKPKKYTSVTDSLKRREIFEEFVFWYFNSFLLPLLSVGSSLLSTGSGTEDVASPRSMQPSPPGDTMLLTSGKTIGKRCVLLSLSILLNRHLRGFLT